MAGFWGSIYENLFGFESKPSKEEVQRQELISFAPPQRDDGAITVEPLGATFAAYVDFDGSVSTETELITRYRNISNQTEIDSALNEIVGDAIITGEDEQEVIELNLEDMKEDVPEKLKEVLDEEFDEILRMMRFNDKGYSIFRKWFVDGRYYMHAIIDKKRPLDGILELRYVDPRKIRKVREVKKTTDPTRSFEVVQTVNEYYVYNDQGFGMNKNIHQGQPTEVKGLKIAKDSIMYATSGITDESGKMVLSYLHKAIKPLNQLRAVEDASVIYRLVRAPERRVFYIDVGDLPKSKADQYMRDMMTKHKNRLVYDSSSGTIRDDRKFITTTEDYWFPRKGEMGTKVETLKGGENLGQMDDVNYFLKRLYRSLNVPVGRLDSENMMGLDVKATGITREEVSFGRFIDRVRSEFSQIFIQVLKQQLLLKGLVSPEEWEEWGDKIKFKWARDNLYAEAKDQEVLLERVQLANQYAPYIGITHSYEWLRRYVFRQSDEDIREIDKEIAAEADDPRYRGKYLPGVQPPMDAMGDGSVYGPDPGPPGGGQPQPNDVPPPLESTMVPKTGRTKG